MLVNLQTVLLATSSIFVLTASALPSKPNAAVQQSSSGEPYVAASIIPAEGFASKKHKITTKRASSTRHAHGMKHTTLHRKHKPAHKSSTASASQGTATNVAEHAEQRQHAQHNASAVVDPTLRSTYTPSTVLSTDVTSTPLHTAPDVFPPANATASDTVGFRFNSTRGASNMTSTHVNSTTAATVNQTSVSAQSADAVNGTYFNGSSPSYAFATPQMDYAMPDKIRGVNIGGWLVLEKWMLPDVFTGNFASAVDQWTFDQIPGAKEALHNHWSTCFTEADVEQLAGWGINAVRIPIGYWAFENACEGTPYIKGAAPFLKKAVKWCQKHGIKVLVDVHGSPGSQNGYDNSGHSGQVAWQTSDNLQITTDVLVKVAKKYGKQKWADTVFAIEMTNEPISWGANSFSTTQSWSQTTYAAMKKVAANPDLRIIMHDGFMGPSSWTSVGAALNGQKKKRNSKFWIDVHMYQNQVDADKQLNQQQHIQKACNYATTEFLPDSSNLPVVVGEWTGATDICANPDGTTTAGTSCSVAGCQCSATTWVGQWNAPLIAATRKFFEAQMDVYEAHTEGWFMWTYNGPGAWGLQNAIQYGLVGAKVTDRMYPGQCN